MGFLKHFSNRISVIVSGLVLCLTFAIGHSAHADPWPIGQPFFNYGNKTCTPVPDIVITVEETGIMGGEPIRKQRIVSRNTCQYYDEDGNLLGWAYEIVGGNWY